MARNWNITKDQFLSQNEVQTLYTALRDAKDLSLQRLTHLHHVREYYLLRTMLETGLRVFEIAALKISDFKDGSIIVQLGKGRKRRNVLLAKSTQKMLTEFIKLKKKTLNESTDNEAYLFTSERKKPYSTRGIRKRVKFWFAKIGLSNNLSCHSCRHSFVTHSLAAGVDLVTVRDNAGHSSLAVTSIYSHAVKDNLGDIELYQT